jgi:predicted transcriptional regulator
MKAKTNNVNIEKDKLEIIKWVTTLNDETSIERLKMLKNSRSKTDWWNQISDEEKNAIDKGLEDIKAGRLKPQREVKKIYEKWL